MGEDRCSGARCKEAAAIGAASVPYTGSLQLRTKCPTAAGSSPVASLAGVMGRVGRMSVEGERRVKTERDGGVSVVSMDDGKANVINFELERELLAAMQEARRNEDAIVLAGRAGRFGAGYDMAVMTSGPDRATELMTAGADLLVELLSYHRPVVAACTGHAVAASAVMLLACDVRVGIDGPYKIGLNELSIGLPLPSFVTILAKERLDPRLLVAATLGATIYDPTGALKAGYLDFLVTDDVVAAAIEQAQRLATFPADAYRLTKELARGDLLNKLRSALRKDIQVVASMLAPT